MSTSTGLRGAGGNPVYKTPFCLRGKKKGPQGAAGEGKGEVLDHKINTNLQSLFASSCKIIREPNLKEMTIVRLFQVA